MQAEFFQFAAGFFTAGAPSYTIDATNLLIRLLGAGILNSSGRAQTFLTTGLSNPRIAGFGFANNASADNAIINASAGAVVYFDVNATAANSTITLQGGSQLTFYSRSTAGNAAISVNGFSSVSFLDNIDRRQHLHHRQQGQRSVRRGTI